MRLGAGREELTDNIDHSVGVVLKKQVGDFVNEGDVIALIYGNLDNTGDKFDDIFEII